MVSNGVRLQGVVDGTEVVEVRGSCPARGLAGLGCGKYHYCSFRDFSIKKLPVQLPGLRRS